MDTKQSGNKPAYRPDKEGRHRTQYDKNKRIVLMTQDICGICGKPVDKTLRYPHPLSPTVDHIIPIIKGGHPSDLDNLQLAHFACNRAKSDKLIDSNSPDKTQINRDLPHSMDWLTYRGR